MPVIPGLRFVPPTSLTAIQHHLTGKPIHAGAYAFQRTTHHDPLIRGFGPAPSQGVLRNGSVGFVTPPQFLEAQEHGQRPFELAVEMGLVAREPFKLVGIE